MKALVIALFLAAIPAQAQYAHRSNPGDPATSAATISVAGGSTTCPGAGCVVLKSEGAATAYVTIGGTWTATLAFYGSNDNFVSLKGLIAYPYNTTTGALSTGVNSTTGNGDWLIPTSGFRAIAVYATAFTSSASMTVRFDASPVLVTQITQGVASGVATPVVAPAITKGTQSATGFTTQDLKDAGRSITILNADGVTPANTDTVLTFDKNIAGTVTTGQTAYTITSGKILRIQNVTWSFTDSSATAVRVRAYLRYNTGGGCVAGSGKVFSCEVASPGLGTSAANEGNAVCAMPIPDGLEITGDGTKSICLSAIASSAAGTLTATVVGYEY